MQHRLNTLLTLALLFFITSTAMSKERIPFRLEGNLLLVKANINGQVGEFILDTGAPELIVNEAHFDGMRIPWALTEIVDFHGHASAAKYFAISNFTLGDLPIKKQYALSIDLSSVERVKGIHLLGIIGYSILKDLDMVLDFDRQELTFAPARRKSTLLINEPALATFDLRMSGHIPYLVGRIGKKKCRLGLDTGAEINILDDRILKQSPDHVDLVQKMHVKGITKNRKSVYSGTIKNLRVGGRYIGTLDVAIVDVQPLNESLTIDLDGILGIPFLKKGRVGVSYKKRKLWVWESEGQLANESLEKGLEVSIDK